MRKAVTRHLPWTLNLLLAATCGWLAWRAHTGGQQVASMESTLELLANEIEYQNSKLAAEMVSGIRKEIEAGNMRNKHLIPVAYSLRNLADSVARPEMLANEPAAVNWYVEFADSLYRMNSASRQLSAAPVDAAALHPLQRRLHVRLVERGALRFLHGQTARILSVPDTLTALERPLSLSVPPGETYTSVVVPYWSASGFHPFERYVFESSLGRIRPQAGGTTARLEIPAPPDSLPPGEAERWLEYHLTIHVDNPAGGNRRKVVVPGKFRIARACN